MGDKMEMKPAVLKELQLMRRDKEAFHHLALLSTFDLVAVFPAAASHLFVILCFHFCDLMLLLVAHSVSSVFFTCCLGLTCRALPFSNSFSIRLLAPEGTAMWSAPPPTPPPPRRTHLSERIPPPPPLRCHLPHDLRLYCYHLTSQSQP
ncbi:hypothetical protein INR49_000551 [Caranx melampygus]|nr:hypothetical protein INR49_000551 [Caranx melampygus]